MSSQDKPTSGPKAELLKDLKSLKSTLDEDDDNVPLLLGDDDDIPLLGDMEEDIPVLDSPDLEELRVATDKASLEAALRHLESMELVPQSSKSAAAEVPPTPKLSLEEQIRASAPPPPVKEAELTKVRENPFMNPQQVAQLELSRKLREETRRAELITSFNKKKPLPPVATPAAAPAPTAAPAAAPESAPPAAALIEEGEDAAAEILKELNDNIPQRNAPLANPGKPPGAATATHKTPAPSEGELELIIDDIVEEYLVVLEAALRKKLKEKLPDLFKK